MSIDQRGFKALIQLEANDFLTAKQKLLNSTVKTISYSNSGVTVTLTSGKKLSGDYALCTFSIGVLQNDDVKFKPPLPGKNFLHNYKTSTHLNRFQARSDPKHSNGHLYQNFPTISKEILVWYRGGVPLGTVLFSPLNASLKMALYADSERGRYPVWQSLDHVNFFPGSGILFVTVTVRDDDLGGRYIWTD